MNELTLTDGFFACADRYLWHEPTCTAIVSDLHLGVESELTHLGIFMPEVLTAPLKASWARMCRRLAAAALRKSRLVIAGDFFDAPRPGDDARQTACELLAALPPTTAITFLIGNHDPAPDLLRECFRGVTVEIAETAAVGGYTVAHGDRLPSPLPTGGLVVGHQHPSVVLRDRVQSAKMMCFAVCRLSPKSRPLLVLPTFSRAPLGSNLLTTRHWILDLPRPDEGDIRIAGIIDSPAPAEPRILDFGPLSGLRLPF